MGTDTVPRDDALEVELAALRARAYGADADIGSDPAALARLSHLEAWHAAGARTADEDEPRPPNSPQPGPAALPRSAAPKRGRLFALGAAAMAAVVAVGAGLFVWESPRPDAILSAVDTKPEPYVLRLVDYARKLLIDESTLQAYGSYRGVELWAADSKIGNSCLLALEPSSDRLLAAGCVPPGAEPSIEIYDVPIYARDEWHIGLPSGTVVRFTSSGETVSAWLYRGSPPP